MLRRPIHARLCADARKGHPAPSRAQDGVVPTLIFRRPTLDAVEGGSLENS
jgi:hypothetical protein